MLSAVMRRFWPEPSFDSELKANTVLYTIGIRVIFLLKVRIIFLLHNLDASIFC